ncbi:MULTISPECIES: AraC family transcriptional regulator [Enterobacterales]|uniref:AraC family transcriptional regulator n=1 Tax=Serratia plymuthica S13 TaxID=1348660 RepID=S4YHG6_SERPL|nr:AraC family transcriptional regulator [Serratia plymuthica]AGP43866.1 AraC family transcriptional regulator [Serratia plymuthica S13]ANJ91850.1 AraC family transcriptional regulator [Serratia plymuthica]ANJ97987.1 AraC family transcriptional regulator [Serratia plymuthica]EKF65256.1 transcriptional regulatory protein [Serratia plymuthica A30]KYG15401.1 Transcriptional activator NphR [Serratia plymuthica]
MKKRAIQIVPSRLHGMEMVTADTDFSFGRHTHDQFGIGLMDRGAQKSLSGRGRVESSAGDIITVNPGEVHDGSPLAGARAWRMIYCHPERLNQCFADISEGKFTSGEFSHPVFSNHHLAACFNRLFCAVTQSDALAAEEALLVIAAALAEIPHPPLASPQDGIVRAREMIDDEPGSPLTLAELATEAGLSQYQLLRGFKRRTGLTPHAYLLQRRLLLARRLILAGDGLAEVADACGFADQSHMTRLFVRSFGYTPGSFSRQSA